MLGRRVLEFNNDVEIGICLPEREADYFYRDGEGDEVIFVHEGEGVVETIFGDAALPQVGLRRDPARDDVPLPLRHAAALADVLHAGRDRDAEPLPQPLRAAARARAVLAARLPCRRPSCKTHRERGEHDLKVRVRGGYQDYVLDYHPFDVVGWDGYVYPYTFNILDFEPKAGRLHQPPPAHQTFQGPNFVICSFCPRMLDWDDEAIVLPYHHSNVQSEEVMYYVDGEYGARKGVDVGCITLHPSGLPHGPQPGLVEKAIGVKQTNELAVMCDTFRPLKLTTLVARARRPELRAVVVRAFDWRDGERLIRFGRGVAAEAVAALGGPGYLLLTTPRAGRRCRRSRRRPPACTTSPGGGVPELAAAALRRDARAIGDAAASSRSAAGA